MRTWDEAQEDARSEYEDTHDGTRWRPLSHSDYEALTIAASVRYATAAKLRNEALEEALAAHREEDHEGARTAALLAIALGLQVLDDTLENQLSEIVTTMMR